jgi:wyosine [tRNA(Phe)-imidazoG37] synthetase (radical SAM superfamily)
MAKEAKSMIVFGPVPSRRLGRSLGINNIPPKVCTYSCIYCQLGRTKKMQVERGAFYESETILRAVQEKIKKTEETGEPIEYLTFVADGEPTLDIDLGMKIDLLKRFHIKIAVITNASLIWRRDVSENLMRADWVSLKIDTTQEQIWRRINRPHRALQQTIILDGMLEFGEMYEGELNTETMLVKGVNDSDDNIGEIAELLYRLTPSRVYVSVPTRPPAEKGITGPSEKFINRAYNILHERIDHVECLLGYEGNAFAFTCNVEEDLLSITAVHPMREEAVSDFLARAGADWYVVHKLIGQDRLIELDYKGHGFYMRKLNAS